MVATRPELKELKEDELTLRAVVDSETCDAWDWIHEESKDWRIDREMAELIMKMSPIGVVYGAQTGQQNGLPTAQACFVRGVKLGLTLARLIKSGELEGLDAWEEDATSSSLTRSGRTIPEP